MAIIFFLFPFISAVAFGQQPSSFGPGKGPPTGEKETLLGEPKKKPFDIKNTNPGLVVPENPEKYTWQLVESAVDRDPSSDAAQVKEKSSAGIFVYQFPRGCIRKEAGTLPAGKEIELKEFRACGRKNYYRIDYQASESNSKNASALKEFWISGDNVKMVGPKK